MPDPYWVIFYISGQTSDLYRLNLLSNILNTRGLRSRMPFPGNRIFPEKIREIPGPVSVPPFGTGQLPSRLSPENEMGIPEFEISGKFGTGREISCWVLKYVI